MNKTIIKTTEQLQEYLPEVAYEKDFKTCVPLIVDAEDNILQPLIGTDLLEFLRQYDPSASGSPSGSASASGESINPEVAARVHYLASKASAYAFAFELSKTGDVKFTSMGLQTIGTDSHQNIFEYQKRDLMAAFAQRMDTAIDSLLIYLEKKKPQIWPEDLRTEYAASFIRNAKEFSRHCNIFESRRTFLAIKELISDNELIKIKPILGEKLFDELKKVLTGKGKEDKDPKRTEIEQSLIKAYIPKALANAALADALETVSLRLFADGATFATFLGLNHKSRDLDFSEKDSRRKSHYNRADTYLRLIRTTLNEHSELFPEYTPEDNAAIDYDNDPEDNHFVM